MDHKAFVFDFRSFDRELRPILERALAQDDTAELVAFIDSNRDVLKDPYEGNPLTDAWDALVETKDVHQYGDFALTKYYDPTAELGLGDTWVEVQEILLRELKSDKAVLGTPLGAQGRLFDPGKMGSYFQSEEEVDEHRRAVLELSDRFPALVPLAELLRAGAKERTGLYVTF